MRFTGRCGGQGGGLACRTHGPPDLGNHSPTAEQKEPQKSFLLPLPRPHQALGQAAPGWSLGEPVLFIWVPTVS